MGSRRKFMRTAVRSLEPKEYRFAEVARGLEVKRIALFQSMRPYDAP
jgi:hypothetical protein